MYHINTMLLIKFLNFFSINIPFLYGFSEYDEDGYLIENNDWENEEDDVYEEDLDELEEDEDQDEWKE